MARIMVNTHARSESGEYLPPHEETSWCAIIGCQPLCKEIKVDEPIEHKAYSVLYTNAPACQGRHHAEDYRQVTAIVIATDPAHAVQKAELHMAAHFIGLHLEEIRLEDDLVIE